MAVLAVLLVTGGTKTAQAEPYVFDTVDVTANADTKRPDLDPESIANPYRVESTARFGTEVISRKEIEAYAPKDVFDLLSKAVGMNLTFQGRKSPYFLDERGGGQLTYILDGAVLPPSSNRILQKLPIADIEQIEIVRGSTSLSLGPTIPIGAGNAGSGLNTGFVVIRTKRPQKTEVEATAYIEGSKSAPPANGQSLYAGTRLGQKGVLNSAWIATGLSRYDRPDNNDRFDGQDGRSGMINGGFEIGKFTLGFMGYLDAGTIDFQRGVTLQGTLDTSKWFYDPLKSSIVSSDMTMKWSENQVTLFSMFKTTYQQTEYDQSFASSDAVNALVAGKYYKEETGGFNLRHSARFGNTLVQLGGQLTSSTGFGPNLSNSYNNFDTSVKGWTIGIEQKLFKDRLNLDAGFRQDIKHVDVSSLSATKDNVATNVDMPAANTFAAGLRWKLAERYAFNARYFYGREGTSGDFALRTQNNVSLDPERQERIELALEAKPADWFMPVLTWFDYDIKNQKTASTSTYVVDGETYYYYTQNDAHRQGIELAIKGRFAKRSSYSFSWTHLFDNNTTTNGVTTDAIGVSNPENLFTATLSHAWGSWQANVSLKQVGSWQTTTSPMGTLYADLGDYTVIDANIAKEFRFPGYRLTTTLYVRNLGNERYATRYVTGYYPDRGRTIGLQLGMSL